MASHTCPGSRPVMICRRSVTPQAARKGSVRSSASKVRIMRDRVAGCGREVKGAFRRLVIDAEAVEFAGRRRFLDERVVNVAVHGALDGLDEAIEFGLLAFGDAQHAAIALVAHPATDA